MSGSRTVTYARSWIQSRRKRRLRSPATAPRVRNRRIPLINSSGSANSTRRVYSRTKNSPRRRPRFWRGFEVYHERCSMVIHCPFGGDLASCPRSRDGREVRFVSALPSGMRPGFSFFTSCHSPPRTARAPHSGTLLPVPRTGRRQPSRKRPRPVPRPRCECGGASSDAEPGNLAARTRSPRAPLLRRGIINST